MSAPRDDRDEGGRPGSRPRGEARETWWERARAAGVACLVILVAVAVALPVLHISEYRLLSTFDEQSHLDYVERAPALLPVRSGDRWDEDVLRAEACRGIDNGFDPPPCSARTLDPDDFEQGAYNSAYIHPPLYYNVTAVIADAFTAAGPRVDEVDAARGVGALWLAAGLLVLWWCGRAAGCRRVPLLAALVLLASHPGVVLQAATVTNDAPNLLVGALVLAASLLACARWTWRSALAVALAGVVAMSVRMQNVTVVLAAASILALVSLSRASAGRRRPTAAAFVRQGTTAACLVLLAAAAMIAVSWNLVWPSVAVRPPEDLPFVVFDEDPADIALHAVATFLPPDLVVPEAVASPATDAVERVTGLLAVAALAVTVAAPVLPGRRRDEDTLRLGHPPSAGPSDEVLVAVGRGTALAAVVSGPLLVLLVYLVVGTSFELQDRYGAALLAPMAVVVAGVWSGRWAMRALVVLATLGVGLEVWALS